MCIPDDCEKHETNSCILKNHSLLKLAECELNSWADSSVD